MLEEYLRHYVCANHEDWTSWLPLAEFSYNNPVHEAVGETPFFLNAGRHPRLPDQVQTGETTPVADAQAFSERMTAVLDPAKQRLQVAREKAKRDADPARRDKQFAVGDMVLLSSKHIALKTPGVNKLLPKYLGPFPITRVLSPVTYELDLPPRMRCHKVFHVSYLLEYRSNGRPQPPPPPLDFDDGEGGVWLEIDSVLAHRLGRGGVIQYMVKWRGLGDEHNEWRDEPGVTEVATAEYWQRVGGRPTDPTPAAQPTRRPRGRGAHTGRGRGRGRSAPGRGRGGRRGRR